MSYSIVLYFYDLQGLLEAYRIVQIALRRLKNHFVTQIKNLYLYLLLKVTKSVLMFLKHKYR